MIEGKAKHGFHLALAMLEQNPTLLHKLLDILSQSVALHLNAQIEAGVQAVMIFDTWGGLLNTAQYEAFSLFYLQKIIQQLRHHYHKETPVILFTKGGKRWLEQLSLTGAEALGVDWETDLHRARAQVGERVALQGNLDPACLLTSAAEIEAGVAQTLSAFGKGSGHVFNLGHGITPNVPVEHVQVLVEAVHRLSQPYHEKR
jgi:uroporphyrinogen decarboxylase